MIKTCVIINTVNAINKKIKTAGYSKFWIMLSDGTNFILGTIPEPLNSVTVLSRIDIVKTKAIVTFPTRESITAWAEDTMN